MNADTTCYRSFFFFQAEDGIRDYKVTGVQTCALPIYNDQTQGKELKVVRVVRKFFLDLELPKGSHHHLEPEEGGGKFRVETDQDREAAEELDDRNQRSPESPWLEPHVHEIVRIGFKIPYLRPAVMNHDDCQDDPQEQ